MDINNHRALLLTLLAGCMVRGAGVAYANKAAPSVPTPSVRPAHVNLPAGKHVPFFAQRNANPTVSNQPNARPSPVSVPAFSLDTTPVSNADFLRFVTQTPAWRRSATPRIFAESTYLSHWDSDVALGAIDGTTPVSHVSWFAADAYCRAQGGRLPTTLQWEYAAYDAGRNRAALQKRILEWYGQPNTDADRKLQAVGLRPSNGYGLQDMVGLVWEWTEDFGSTMLGSEPRSSGTKEEAQFCGAGSLGALDPGDYATFMRYSFRTSLHGNFTTANLGFRCAHKVTP